MTERISIGQLFPGPVSPASVKRAANGSLTSNAPGRTFQDILQDKVVRFSQHAEQRLKQRGIQLKPEQLSKIEAAIDKAAAKGAKDSLLLYQDMALIVNVKNRTVVTAMDGTTMNDNVFTNIDSAVIVK